jgi:type II secretory pathway component PulF
VAIFIYKAKKGPDEAEEGSIEADSESAAVGQLMQAGLYPISIKEKTALSEQGSGASLFFVKKIKTRDLANFTRQLSELLDSGIALYNALNIIENQIDNPHLKDIIGSVKGKIKDGKTLSESLNTYPDIFSKVYVNLVKSGEAGGMLNEVLNNASDFLEKQEESRSKILSSLAYPALMTAVGGLTIFILMTFVIPKLAKMFIDMGDVLPMPTRILIGTADLLKSYWILLAIFIAGAVISIKKIKPGSAAGKKMDKIKLNLPLFGKFIKNTELARFTRTLSTLLKNGVPILNALKIALDAVENSLIKEDIDSVCDDVKAGSSLAAALKKGKFFPQFVVNMAAIGEEGGILDKTLLKVARSYESETDRALKTMSTLIEPVVILIMGAIVGFIVISMLLPVFQISLSTH